MCITFAIILKLFIYKVFSTYNYQQNNPSAIYNHRGMLINMLISIKSVGKSENMSWKTTFLEDIDDA
jgi:hypothetical protein